MGWPTAVAIMVVIGIIGKVLTARYQAMNGIIQDEDGNQSFVGNEGGDNHTQREVEELRERVKVLERIATDGNSTSAIETRKISAEIEALRDKQDS